MDTYITIVIALGGIATGIGAIWTAMLARRQLGEQRRLFKRTRSSQDARQSSWEQSLIQQRESLQGQNGGARLNLEVDVMYKLWTRWDSRDYQNSNPLISSGWTSELGRVSR
jgi:hypothetical protein